MMLAQLASGRMRDRMQVVQQRFALVAMASVLAATGGTLLLVALYIALSRAVGTLPALGILAGFALAAAGGIFATLSVAERQEREQQRSYQPGPDGVEYTSAVVRALSSTRRRKGGSGAAIGAGMLGLGLVILLVSSVVGDDEDKE